MRAESPEPLCDPLLKHLGIRHGFGRRGSQVPEKTVFPNQIHGSKVVLAEAWEAPGVPDADVILSSPGRPPSIGIVTADCVPILVASGDGRYVAAIHAGWRGLAAGVIEAGVGDLAKRCGGAEIFAAVGPAARSCCYEVDEPVRRGLAERYPGWLKDPILRPGRKGHFLLDLPRLATRALEATGVKRAQIGTKYRLCTVCDPDRFESYRRDGEASGRLRHFIVRVAPGSTQG